jgi:hypothetical protein
VQAGSYVLRSSYLPKRRTLALYTETSPHRSLSEKHSSVGASTSGWSRAISERYRLRLSDELADWFDSGVCDSLGQGEFCEPAHPEQLVQESPECIWPGLMPPDVLPLVSNGLGDWLCGRVSASDTIDEVIYWYHGGGDYLPYGNGLAEAIVFDTLAERLPGRRQLLAIPAEREPLEHQTIVSGPLVEWALKRLPKDVAAVLDIEAPPTLVASELARHKIAVDAVNCDAVLAALDSDLRTRLRSADANALGVSWDRDVAKWMFDTDTIPAMVRSQLIERLSHDGSLQFHQDWSTVERICKELAAERSDLGWVYDCLGWSAQRRGNLQAAGDYYAKAAVTSVFTDQAVRFKTHFDSDHSAKFSVARLIELGQADRLDSRYIEALTQVDKPNWRELVVEYWLDKAAAHQGPAAERYELLYRAGWDVGCESMKRYRDLLCMLAEAAKESQQFARAEVALTHAACIEERYLRRNR